MAPLEVLLGSLGLFMGPLEALLGPLGYLMGPLKVLLSPLFSFGTSRGSHWGSTSGFFGPIESKSSLACLLGLLKASLGSQAGL